MCELTTRADNGKQVGTSNDVEYFETPTATTPFAKYISKNNTAGDGNLEVYTYNGCATITTYHAYCKGNCDILFKQIVKGISFVNVNTDYTVTEKQAISNCSSLPSFPVNIKYIDINFGNIPLLEYNHLDINTPATLTDISGGSDNEGVFTSCFSLSGPNDGEEYINSTYNPPPVQANPGSAGDPGTTPPPPPSSGAGNVNDNIIIDDGNSWFTSAKPNISLSNVLNAVAYPNPANKDLHIDLQSEMNTFAFINITDLSGKELVASKQKLHIGNNKIIVEIDMLKAGFYLLKIITNNKSSVIKITIQ